jgi:calcium/calmodulin-dependent protein kinase (CaM kinase) II
MGSDPIKHQFGNAQSMRKAQPRNLKMSSSIETELIDVTNELLEAIAAGNWDKYQELCDPSITAIEAESYGLPVRGLDFHRFYFGPGGSRGKHRTTISSQMVHLAGDVGVIAYVRLVQRESEGNFKSVAMAETRVWRKMDGKWKHIHFHRSPMGSH